MTIGQAKPNKGNRGQGALEYLIILGAAVMIAVVVVGKMMGILGNQSKKMEKEECIKFVQAVCRALENPATAAATDNAQDAVATEFANMLHSANMTNLQCSYSTSGSDINCYVAGSSSGGTALLTLEADPLDGTIKITSGYILVHGTKLYAVSSLNNVISPNDYYCWGQDNNTKVFGTAYARNIINCNQILGAV